MSVNAAAEPTGYGTPGYRAYILGVLTIAYIFNFIDRIMISILSEPIINYFNLTDTQFGLLSGIAFALFYTTVGIPVARLSERINRTWIIGGAILLWSLMTALCGLATSFWMLFLFRLGVGIGEAGLTPPANSLISDYFTPSARARALAVYAMGITLGMCAANLFVGLTGAQVSWQQTFIVIGLAGLPIGLLVLFTIKEPPRGYSDYPGTPKPENTGFMDSLAELVSKKSFWTVVLGVAIASFVSYGMGNFIISFLVRNHSITVSQAALWYMAPLALAGASGTWACGTLVARFGGGRHTVGLWLAALSLVIAGIAFVAAFNVGVLAYVFPLLLVANFFQYWFLGPMYAAVGAVVSGPTRATAVAIMLFIVNLLGYGLGPLFVGWLSDRLAAAALADVQGLSLAICKGDKTSLPVSQVETCAAASADGLQNSVTITVLMFLLAALCFAVSARLVKQDATAVSAP